MRQTHDEITQNVAERWCREVACRDDARIAGCLYRKQAVDGVYWLDEGAVLDEFFHFLRTIWVASLVETERKAVVPAASTCCTGCWKCAITGSSVRYRKPRG